MSRPKGTGCLYHRPDSSVWWIKYSRNGRTFRESTGTTDDQKAKRKLKHRLAEIVTGTFVGPELERVRVDELAEDFLRDYRINNRKSFDDAETRWKLHLKPFFGHLRAAGVTSGDLARYVDARQKAEAANATINRELAALKRMFRLGQQATPPKVRHIPRFPRLTEANARMGFLTDQQRTALEAQCASVGLWLRGMFEVGCTYGWRSSEVRNLRVRHVDLMACTIRLDPGTTKNREARVVTFERTSTLNELLAACVHGKMSDDFVFTRENGKPVRDFRGTWNTACEAAGVPGLLFHDLRRTAARNLRRAGVAENVIMKIGGWRTASVFHRYAIVAETDIADAVRKLEADKKVRAAEAEKDGTVHVSVTLKGATAPVVAKPTRPN